MTFCRKNFYHAQELQKRAYNKGVNLRSYAPGDKIWLNSKYIKIKQNQKLKAKFFELFRSFTSFRQQSLQTQIIKVVDDI